MAENNDNDDTSVDSDFSGPYDPQDLDEEGLRLLKENHIWVSALYVTLAGYRNPNHGFDELSVDWESDGSAISDNTHLHWLEIRDCIDQTDLEDVSSRDLRARIRNAKAFYRAVALNKSIRYLMLEGNVDRSVAMEDVVSILTPCLRESPKLRYFVIGGFDLSARTAQLLASAISSCTATLSTFGLKRVNGITAASMSNILEGVKKGTSIDSLYLDENTISDEVATVLGNALPTLSNLKSLSLAGDYDFQRGRITVEGVEAISQGLKNSSIESLSFRETEIGPNGAIVLAGALSINEVKVKALDLTQAISSYRAEYNLSAQGWQNFFELLQSSALVDLKLGGNNIGDAQIDGFVEYLNGSSVESLNLWNVTSLSSSGWAGFFVGLRGNTSLRTLSMHAVNKMRMKCDVVLHALCDNTTIESIYNSNHSLVKVEGVWELMGFMGEASEATRSTVSECKRLLEMNEGANKAKVARQKVLEFYFRNGDENLQELVAMEVDLMPRVLQWIGKDTMKVSYQLIRSMPSLFSTKGLGGKRKRGTTASE